MHFTTIVKIPADAIEQIGLELRGLVMEELKKYQELFNISNQELNRIEEVYTFVLKEYIEKQSTSCDGYHLTRSQVDDIAQSLENGYKIAAIKSFREATRADLLDAKNFIMKFWVMSDGAIAFRNSFA